MKKKYIELQILVDETVENITYVGKAEVGRKKSTAYWQIMKIDETGVITEVKFPNNNNGDPSEDFIFIWEDRELLTYEIPA